MKKYWKDNFIVNYAFVSLMVFSIEMLFRFLSNFRIISISSIRILTGVLLLSLIITFLSSMCKKRWVKTTINLVYILFATIYSWLQLGFMNFIGVYMSLNTSSQFGAVTGYIKDFLASFYLKYYLIFIPFIISIIVYIFGLKKLEYMEVAMNKRKFIVLGYLIFLILFYTSSVLAPFMQNKYQLKSNKELFNSPSIPTLTANQYGILGFGFLDFKSYLFPVEEVITVIKEEENPKEEENIPLYDLKQLADDEYGSRYSNINNYFASKTYIGKNDYTGMFEGKNVIVMLIESGSNALINEEYFPNFYNLYSNGWNFENNYSPRNSCATGNNEFSAMTSLYSIYNTCTSNVYKNNTYFNAIFNLFDNKGYTTTSMHDFTEWYYQRNVIHQNMGSMKYYNAKALGISTANSYGEWPSDEVFLDTAMDILLSSDNEEPFMTFLTTVTAHQPYSSSTTYGDLYMQEFKDLGYSTAVSRYLSKLKVTDNAIGIMVNRLKEAGKLDDTVIVLLADHYPYGLSKNYIKEMIDGDLSDYEIERTPLVIYNSKMTPKTFSSYSSYINLVPTLANLMNLPYDSRLYMGEDLLSDEYQSIVIFADGSWKNEKAYYNAASGKIKYYTEEEYTEEEIININKMVNMKISISSNAIKSNYFNYLGGIVDNYKLSE